jgi:hypothetical protein
MVTRCQSIDDVVARLIHGDAGLEPNAREQLVSVFSQIYATLHTSKQEVTVHLRAA